MAERTLRGSRLVSHSLETDEHVVPSERQITAYVCAQGHRTELPFSIEAEIPPTWECRCGLDARLVDGPEPEVKPVKHQRTHWDMLLERRSEKELEDILKERLELLREGEIGPAHLHRANAKRRAKANV
jgi:hypothetical protein